MRRANVFGFVNKGLTCILVMTGLCVSARGQAPPSPPGERVPSAAAVPAGNDIVEVDAQGEGATRDEALRAALRAALERGGRTEIFSQTDVENFQVMHDTIIARAQGLVKDFKVLEEKALDGGGFKLRIRARVSKSVLAATWAELQNVLRQVGRPKVLVWINEKIDDRLQDESLLESQIEERLLKSGFDLVARKAVEAAKRKDLAAATASRDTAKLQALAKEFEAHLFIAGTANAHHAEATSVYNVPMVAYNCDAEVKAYYTDTGKLLASKGLPNQRGLARGRNQYSPQAGRQALENISSALVDAIYQQVMEQWTTAIGAGGELMLEVDGLKFAQANRLRKALEDMDKIRHVNMDYTQGTAKYRINTPLTAQDLAERLSEGEFAKLIEITDLKLSRIQAKAAAGEGK